jgi:hypothetical protein
LTGAEAALLRDAVIAAGAGGFAVTGADADLRATRRLAADAGAFVWTGTAANLRAAVAVRVRRASQGELRRKVSASGRFGT